MRNTLAGLVCCLAFAGCQAPEPPAGPEATPEEAVAQVRELFSEYQADWNNGDLEGVFGVLAEDVVQMGPTSVFVGKDALMADWRRHMNENEDVWTPTIDDIRAAGDLVFIVGHFTEIATPRSGGEANHHGGEGVWVFRRTSLGSWELVLEQWFARDPDSFEAPGEG
jgi:ketosteroid isomerase-like protein